MTTEQTTDAPAPEARVFKAEVQQVLHILAHSLYTDREIFLRELISNASDALNRMQFEQLTNSEVLNPEAEPAIWVEADSEARTITVRDTGTGMTADELVEHLGTIAQSSARAFVQQTREGHKATASEIIGQFGVGFYSVFMVADKVTVVSRSYRPEAAAAVWESTGGDSYTLGPAEREERGTTVTLHLKEDASEFASGWRLEQIVKKHSDFVAFPIYSGDRQLNQRKALWRRAPREVEADEYKNLYRQLTFDSDEPLLHLHLSTDVPVDLHSVLFVPAKRERGLIERRVEGKIKLYSRKVLILDEARELLPSYFRFVEGVVDSEDLPLNVSRESVQSSPVMQRIKKTLTSRLHRELNELADSKPEQFAAFWKEFGVFIKEGVATDYEGRNDLLKLLRFQTTRGGDDELVTLGQYKSRIVDGQSEIYYVLAASPEAARSSPHLDPFSARGIEVLLFTDLMDGFMLSGLRDFDGMKLRNVDEAELELPGEVEAAAPQVGDEQFAKLAERVAAVLGERVKEVRASKVLRDSPARLVSADDGMGREMQRIQQLLGREAEQPQRIIELNQASGLVAALAQRVEANADDPVVTAAVEQLYDNALLIEGLHQNPAAMVPRILALIEAAARAE